MLIREALRVITKTEITPCLSSLLFTSLPKPFLEKMLAELITIEEFYLAVTMRERVTEKIFLIPATVHKSRLKDSFRDRELLYFMRVTVCPVHGQWPGESKSWKTHCPRLHL